MRTKKINLVAADMGYGHQRAAYPLLELSAGEIITLNNYPGIPDWEKKYWLKSLHSYEQVSRLKKIPILGKIVFSIMDYFQKIQPRYPFRDLSNPTIQQKYFYKFIRKGIGKHLIEQLKDSELPFVTTFFVAADVAEYYNYPHDIYCIICDTDASRAWAPLKPKTSRIKFLVPSEKVKERFLMYGVRSKNIIVSGFPLPKENISSDKHILINDLIYRVKLLDPQERYRKHYEPLLKKIGVINSRRNNLSLTITYAVGGAGAQVDTGIIILNKLAARIRNKEFQLNLVAGSRLEVKNSFIKAVKSAHLKLGQGVNIIYDPIKTEYFKKFNKILRDTDILWTKPSELSFYAALGLPIIINNPVGSQEDFNRAWLLSIGAGIDSLDVEYVDEWLPNLLNSGRLARAAIDGFLNAEQMGVYNIEKIVLK